MFANRGATLLVVAGLLATSTATVAAPAQTSRTITAGALRDWPPHYLVDEHDRPIGFAIDIFNDVAERAHLTVKYRVFEDFSDMEEAFKRDQIDVIPNFGITPSRSAFAAFTPPVETFAIRLFIRHDTPGITKLADLTGKRVAAVSSNAAIQLLRDAGIQPVIYPNASAALFDLVAGRVDALLYPESVLRALAREVSVADRIRAVGPPLAEIKRAIAVHHEDTRLLAVLSNAVDELLRSDDYRRIYVRWHGKDAPFWNVHRVVLAAGLLIASLLLGVGVWRLRVLAVHNRELRARIAERDAAEAARSESEQNYRRIVETCNEGVWIIDDQQNTTFVNQRMAEMVGLQPEEMIGRPLSEFIDAELDSQVERNMQRRREGIAEVHEFRLRHSSGQPVHTLMATSPIVEEGNFHGALAMVTDVTLHRELQDQLWQSQKLEALGRLAGGVAHDFNNLLLVINAAISLATRSLPPGSPASKELAEIADASERAKALTAQLLAFSRKQVTSPELVRPAARIAGSGMLLRRMVGEDIELALPAPENDSLVLIDPGQLDQLVFNMAVNARDALPDGGRFEIRVESIQSVRDGGSFPEVLLTFADNGSGMPPEVQARIFEPFFTTKGEGVGTGLGLATCYGIVTGAGGRIEVDSKPGAGTRFRVYFPVASERAGQRAEPPDLAAEPTPALTVLLVEDEPIVRRLVARLLEDSGHRVLEAESPEQALVLCEGHTGDVDLLLTDIIMPGMNGRELGRRTRELVPDLPILYVSGHTDRALGSVDELDSRESFLPKPFSPDDLFRVIGEMMERTRNGRNAKVG